jgi:hypothetical protein
MRMPKLPVLRIRLFLIVTFEAFTRMSPEMSSPSTTCPGEPRTREPDALRATPAGTPVSPAPGNAPDGNHVVGGPVVPGL